jgi:hypothetical protein
MYGQRTITWCKFYQIKKYPVDLKLCTMKRTEMWQMDHASLMELHDSTQIWHFDKLINHKNDFGIAAETHFFATSHGKGPCDAVGGTTKWQTAKPNLQHPHDEQILTLQDFYKFAQEIIYGIKYLYMSQVDTV